MSSCVHEVDYAIEMDRGCPAMRALANLAVWSGILVAEASA